MYAPECARTQVRGPMYIYIRVHVDFAGKTQREKAPVCTRFYGRKMESQCYRWSRSEARVGGILAGAFNSSIARYCFEARANGVGKNSFFPCLSARPPSTSSRPFSSRAHVDFVSSLCLFLFPFLYRSLSLFRLLSTGSSLPGCWSPRGGGGKLSGHRVYM